jgi:hypothetical protein
MALTRKLLKGMGLTDEQVDTIIEAHMDTVDGLKADVSKYKGDAEKLPGVQKELDEMKAANNDEKARDWEKKYNDLLSEKSRNEKEKAYRAILEDAGLNKKGIDKAVKYAAWDSLELDGKGGLNGAKDLIKSAKEEWSEYVETTTVTGANTATPPANGGGAKLTKADIYKKDEKGRYVMSTSDRQKALAENPNLMN